MPQQIIIPLILAAIIFYVYRSGLIASLQRSGIGTKPPADLALQTQAKQNDKIVIIKDVSYPDLKRVRIGFCAAYNEERFLARPRLIKLSERRFAVIFP